MESEADDIVRAVNDELESEGYTPLLTQVYRFEYSEWVIEIYDYGRRPWGEMPRYSALAYREDTEQPQAASHFEGDDFEHVLATILRITLGLLSRKSPT